MLVVFIVITGVFNFVETKLRVTNSLCTKITYKPLSNDLPFSLLLKDFLPLSITLEIKSWDLCPFYNLDEIYIYNKHALNERQFFARHCARSKGLQDEASEMKLQIG